MESEYSTSPCGMECPGCSKFIENAPDTISNDSSYCSGCRKKNLGLVDNDREKVCIIFLCSHRKGLNYCCECGMFPCKLLISPEWNESDTDVKERVLNLCFIREMGAGKWLDKSKKSYIDKNKDDVNDK